MYFINKGARVDCRAEVQMVSKSKQKPNLILATNHFVQHRYFLIASTDTYVWSLVRLKPTKAWLKLSLN